MASITKKEVYDQMLESFEGLAFPLAVLGVMSDEEHRQTAFASVWLPALEREMSQFERDELNKALNRVGRCMVPAFLRMIQKKYPDVTGL